MPETASAILSPSAVLNEHCPRCASTSVATLRIIYEEAIHLLRQNPTGAQARALAVQTAPPRPRPEKPIITRVLVLIAVLVIGMSVLIAASRSLHLSGPGGISPAFCVAVPCLIMLIVSLVQWTKVTSWNQKTLPENIRAWADRRVCRSCGLSFVAAAANKSGLVPQSIATSSASTVTT